MSPDSTQLKAVSIFSVVVTSSEIIIAAQGIYDGDYEPLHDQAVRVCVL